MAENTRDANIGNELTDARRAAKQVDLLAPRGHDHPAQRVVAGIPGERLPCLVECGIDDPEIPLDGRHGFGREAGPRLFQRAGQVRTDRGVFRFERADVAGRHGGRPIPRQ